MAIKLQRIINLTKEMINYNTADGIATVAEKV